MSKTSKIDFRLADDARADLEALARRHRRTLGAELRAALNAWRDMHVPAARWLDAEGDHDA